MGFVTIRDVAWSNMAAAGIIITLPVLVFTLLVQKNLVQGPYGRSRKGIKRRILMKYLSRASENVHYLLNREMEPRLYVKPGETVKGRMRTRRCKLSER